MPQEYSLTVVNLIINLIGVGIVPIVIIMIKASAARRSGEIQALVLKISEAEKEASDKAKEIAQLAEKQYADIQHRLDRIENGVLERMARLEAKLDTHLQWHLLVSAKEKVL